MSKLILDLCGGTGSWSLPYAEDDDYTVRVIDLHEWETDVDGVDVRLLEYIPDDVYGILAAPPCTHLASSGARWWAEKGEAKLLEALAIADACLRVVLLKKPKGFWALENPVGRLRRFYGPPRYIFNPSDHGDPWTKRTVLWGEFNIPEQHPVEPTEGSKAWNMAPSPESAMLRSATPPGFSRDFFNANR